MAGAALGFVLLDYTLWVWHLLNHRVPFLWRFHAAHHLDLDMDATIALRFHPGEHLLSVPFRALQVAIIGVDVRVLVAWQTALLVSTEFHHSNTMNPARRGLALTKRPCRSRDDPPPAVRRRKLDLHLSPGRRGDP